METTTTTESNLPSGLPRSPRRRTGVRNQPETILDRRDSAD